MKNTWLVTRTGFALFAMFFGSGNLVFPLTVGQQSEGHYLLAALGIILTGVVMPFVGIFGMALYEGNLSNFFSCLGKRGIFLFSFLALALMGPFGVLARCLTVAHGALLLLLPGASLPLSSALMCLGIYCMTVNTNKIVSRLGSVLTPFLLVSIALIAFFGLTQGTFPQETPSQGFSAFQNGFFTGYQIMDLLAAFFFSQFMITQLNLSATENGRPFSLRFFYQSACVGAGILAAVYLALVLLGSIYSPLLQNAAPQEMLGIIAMASLGNIAAPCVALAVLFACLTTAIVLASLFADFLRVEVTKGKINNHFALAITLGISFLVSTFDFAGIAKFLSPILETIYPALITLTLVNIGRYYLKLKPSHWPFTLTLVLKLLWV